MPKFQRLSPLIDNINSPAAVAVDNKGKIYVANSKNNKILIVNQQGQNINSIKGLAYPISVAVDKDGRIYVGNEKNGNVEVFDANLKPLHKLGFQNGEFKQPNDIAIDNITGNIYVADYIKCVVGIYNSAGEFVRYLGQKGTGNGEFYFPVSVAIDVNTKEIIVLDRALKKSGGMGMGGSWLPGARIQFFSMDGTFLRSFNKSGTATGELSRAQRVEVDQQRRLYITDSYLHSVMVYDNAGVFLGAIFDNDNPLRTPLGLALDRNNKLYIASNMKKRVDVYGIDDFLSLNVEPLNLSISDLKEDTTPSTGKAIILHNTGTLPLSWAAVVNASWISLSDNQGSLDTGQDGTFYAAVDTTGLKLGTYIGSINVSVNAIETAIVYVKLTVQKAPILSVSPLSIDLTYEIYGIGSKVSYETVTITNKGYLPLYWNMSADQPWIVLKTNSGTLPANASGTKKVVVQTNAQSLPPGIYKGIITVTGQDAVASPMFINVTLSITEQVTPPDKGKDKDKNKDSDNDGIPDDRENCPQDPNKFDPGTCGCGIPDEDINNNGIIDCLEKKKNKIIFPIKTKDGTIIFLSL